MKKQKPSQVKHALGQLEESEENGEKQLLKIVIIIK